MTGDLLRAARRPWGIALPGLLIAVAVLLAQGSAAPGAALRPLAGTIHARDFRLPRGAVRVVNDDLTISAKRNITIDGTLLVRAGRDVLLRAGHALSIGKTGRVSALPRRASASGPPQVIQGHGLIQIQGSDMVAINGGTLNPPAGTSVKIATAEFGSIELRNAGIATKNGAASGRPGVDGQNAGSIILGGLFGENAKIELIGVTLNAGDGGAGYRDTRGEVKGSRPNPCHDSGGGGLDRSRREFRGTDGGKGGNVRLMAKQVINRHSIVFVGDGGSGGGAGGAASAGHAAHGGQDLLTWSGSGGEGGGIFILGSYTGEPIRTGRGGDAGDARGSAGNGPSNCDGGRTSAILGRPGEEGVRKGKGAKEPPRGARYGDISLSGGANGGPGEDRNHAAGDGGRVRLLLPGPRKNHPRDPKPNFFGVYFGHIVTSGYADGGAGFADCVSSPTTNGTDGGAGGSVSAGLFRNAVESPRQIARLSFRATDAFNGGRGGRGDPPGAGGAAGVTNYSHEGSNSFERGANGDPCPGTGENSPPQATLAAEFFPAASAGACENTVANVNYGETCYTLRASDPDGDPLSFGWSQVPPFADGGCTDFHLAPSPPAPPDTSVWHHGEEDGCSHAAEGPDGHEGIVSAIVKDGHYTCVATYLGTKTGELAGLAPCFPSNRYVLTVVKPYLGATPPGGGTVRSAGESIDCGPNCKLQAAGFAPNEPVTLTAAPEANWIFVGWKGGGCSGNAPTCTVTMITDQEVLATFRPM